MSKPDLTIKEWWLVLDALKSTALLSHMQPSVYLPHSIEDAIHLEGLGKKWQVHADAFLTKLEDLSEAEWNSLWDVVQGFWELGGWENTDLIPGESDPTQHVRRAT